MHPSIHFCNDLMSVHHAPSPALVCRVGGGGELVTMSAGLSVALGISPYFMKITFWDSGCDVTF